LLRACGFLFFLSFELRLDELTLFALFRESFDGGEVFGFDFSFWERASELCVFSSAN